MLLINHLMMSFIFALFCSHSAMQEMNQDPLASVKIASVQLPDGLEAGIAGGLVIENIEEIEVVPPLTLDDEPGL